MDFLCLVFNASERNKAEKSLNSTIEYEDFIPGILFIAAVAPSVFTIFLSFSVELFSL